MIEESIHSLVNRLQLKQAKLEAIREAAVAVVEYIGDCGLDTVDGIACLVPKDKLDKLKEALDDIG